MRSRGLMLLLLAVIAGLLAMVLASRWLKTQGTAKTNHVVTTLQPVSAGVVLTAEMLSVSEWPAGKEPPGAQTDVDKVLGRVTAGAMLAGEPVLEGRLTPPGTKGGLSALVAPGKRAMTVRVNDVVGVAGFALPGTFVDVLVNTQQDIGGAGSNEQRAISKIVLDRMLVLAVAQDVESDPTKPKVVNAVTLEVTPEQAEVLDLARSVGTLSLVLRNQTEATATGTHGVTKDQLLALASTRPVPAPVAAPARVAVPVAAARVAPVPASARTCVDLFRGTTKVTECF